MRATASSCSTRRDLAALRHDEPAVAARRVRAARQRRRRLRRRARAAATSACACTAPPVRPARGCSGASATPTRSSPTPCAGTCAARRRCGRDAVFAEIAHLPEGRTGKLIARPLLRGHELEFLGRSGAPRDAVLRVDDLLVSVRGDRIVLRSRRLGCEVEPRLTSAYNYALASSLGAVPLPRHAPGAGRRRRHRVELGRARRRAVPAARGRGARGARPGALDRAPRGAGEPPRTPAATPSAGGRWPRCASGGACRAGSRWPTATTSSRSTSTRSSRRTRSCGSRRRGRASGSSSCGPTRPSCASPAPTAATRASCSCRSRASASRRRR